jgi:hypothetical protein
MWLARFITFLVAIMFKDVKLQIDLYQFFGGLASHWPSHVMGL